MRDFPGLIGVGPSPWIQEPTTPEDVRYEVQGKRATLNEYNVSLALDKLGFDYVFQYAIDGGKSRKFGFVVDFLVITIPNYTPLWVHGEYWHQASQRAEDLRQQDIIVQRLGRQGVNPPVEVWGDQSNDEQTALNTLRTLLL